MVQQIKSDKYRFIQQPKAVRPFASRTHTDSQRLKTMDERVLHQAWQKAGNFAMELDADDGFAYEIVYAGHYTPSVGADFKGAILKRSDGKKITGDVEIHIGEDDWQAHGHHRDANYNAVVLHVVFKFGKTRAHTSDGREPPCVLLNLERLSKLRDVPRTQSVFLRADVSASGDERFINRASGYRLEMLTNGADQAIYAAILECLGYSRNKTGFLRLAARLPWRVVMQLADKQVEPTMLFAGGFGKRPPAVPKLTGRAPDWNLCAGRPPNHPQNRIRAAVNLIIGIKHAGGPAQYCQNVLFETPDDHNALIKAFSAVSQAQNTKKVCRIGKQRASEIVINAILPALFALGELTGAVRLSRLALYAYRTFPALQTNSKLTEAMRIFDIQDATHSSLKAHEQQGLLHLYQSFSLNLCHAKQAVAV